MTIEHRNQVCLLILEHSVERERVDLRRSAKRNKSEAEEATQRRRDKETMHASSTLVYLIDHYDYSPKQTVNSPRDYGCATDICISNAF